MAQITEHFYLSEFEVSREAAIHRIDNSVPKALLPNVRRTALLLEEVRKLVGGVPVVISSGYRCPKVNELAGGSVTSAHMDGRAADFHVPGLSIDALAAKLAASNIAFDKLIKEYGAWVHIQVRKDAGPARREVLTKDATHDYTPGLH
jgi:zinc D-Ala-D-Ala carboxypeptidase